MNMVWFNFRLQSDCGLISSSSFCLKIGIHYANIWGVKAGHFVCVYKEIIILLIKCILWYIKYLKRCYNINVYIIQSLFIASACGLLSAYSCDGYNCTNS